MRDGSEGTLHKLGTPGTDSIHTVVAPFLATTSIHFDLEPPKMPKVGWPTLTGKESKGRDYLAKAGPIKISSLGVVGKDGAIPPTSPQEKARIAAAAKTAGKSFSDDDYQAN